MTAPATLLSFVWGLPGVSAADVDRFLGLGDHARMLALLDETDPWIIAERFLQGAAGHPSTQGRRFRIRSRPVVRVGTWHTPLDVYVTWHAVYGTATVVASLRIAHDELAAPERIDVVVALIQSLAGRVGTQGQLSVTNPGQLQSPSLREAVIALLARIDPSAPRFFGGAVHGWCVEHRAYDGATANPNAGSLAEDYALATGDEGWRFVDDGIALARFGTPWTTRQFVDVRTAGHGVVMRNYKDPHYEKSQEEFVSTYFGTPEPYFAIDAQVAGVDHGVLSTLERVTVRRARAEAWLAEARTLQEQGGNSFKLLRTKLDNVNELVQSVLIAEVDSLEKMLSDRSGLSRLVDQLDRLGEALDEHTRFAYEKAVNRSIWLLTIVTILLAAAALFDGPLSALGDWLLSRVALGD